MSANIDKLIGILEKSEAIYRQLLPVIQTEKQAALTAKPDQLTSATEKKEELLVRLQQLERNRQILINRISTESGIPVKDITLSALSKKTDDVRAAKVKRLSDSLNALVPVIKKANEENRAVIQHCLNIVQSALGFFQHWVMPTDVYGASGRMSMQHKGGKLISGAV